MKKNIIITGAASGIGLSSAMQLDNCKNNLILIGRSVEKLQELSKNIKTTSQIFQIDLTKIEELTTLFNRLPSKIDGFIHAAGIESVCPLKLINHEKFDEIMRLHVYSFIEIVKYIDKNKNKTDEYETSIVALSSIASDQGGIGQSMYSASKSALEAVGRVLTKELAPKRIRINTLKPGIVNTAMTGRWMRKVGISDLSELAKMQINGIASPEEIAHLIVFLLSEHSRHIAGTQINIDGGGPSGRIF
jgi:short-subunit dehydrogenase